ncbi:MAG: thioredoxin domain-containing protein, partial [Deltaproteobacteria bacterium]
MTNPLPGAPPFDDTHLLARLATSARAGEPPHTRHLRPDGTPLYTNRLALESSPYLRQHAHNPVDWHPWGDEAFTAAKRLERPVLLSVGYSTCHWCHVMEEESFEDEEIARYLNENYVAIKVDREERPDVDSLYMTAVQAMSGSGGWPMTVWLTPERQPFYGGTYFPARDGERGVRTGFLTMLKTLKEAFDRQPLRVADAAADVAERVRQSAGPAAPSGVPGAAALHAAAREAGAHFDAANGGADRAPKFPSGLPLRFLLRYHRRTGDEQAMRMATLTLEKMAAGGVHDQVGGGFHRYSTDARWLVPHFEKMLYDNALLALTYLDAYQATGREDFAGVVRDILGYVARDMTAPEGGFYGATDADSPDAEGRPEEGWFFTWTPAEIEAAVGAERAGFVTAYYGVTPAGNFHGRSILSTPRPLADVARELGLTPAEAESTLAESRRALLAARSRRPSPSRDEKVVAGWNGLMISAFARAALILGDGQYAGQAARAADFLLARRDREGRLPRAVKDGRAGSPGYLEDYAFLAAGLLDLYETTGASRWLEAAIALDGVLARR